MSNNEIMLLAALVVNVVIGFVALLFMREQYRLLADDFNALQVECEHYRQVLGLPVPDVTANEDGQKGGA